jgi:lipoprotein-releasing system ATP-binding protein
MLRVTGVGKSYPSPQGAVEVLQGVGLALDSGDAIAITGPSGSGKSTLLYLLGALEPPTSGSITLDEVDPFRLPPAALAVFRNRQIGFVFQDHCLLPQCSVLENVLVPTLVGTADPGAEARAGALIEQVGLAHRLSHLPGQLSGGEKQRVALARALVRQPRLLLCDEPTGNLDRAAADTVASMLFTLQRAQSAMLIVVTHSADLAARFPVRFELADRTLRRAA